MKFKKVKCCYCGKLFEIPIGQYNYRVIKHGLNIYCSRKHFGMARRQYLPTWLKKQEKAEYDKAYRDKNEKRLKKLGNKWFKKDYAANPEKYRKERQRRKEEHNEYCRQPEYRKKKKEYDQKRCAKLFYGEFGEAAIALRQLASIVDNRKAKQDQDNNNKSKKRKRYGKTYSKKPQERPLAINTGR